MAIGSGASKSGAVVVPSDSALGIRSLLELTMGTNLATGLPALVMTNSPHAVTRSSNRERWVLTWETLTVFIMTLAFA